MKLSRPVAELIESLEKKGQSKPYGVVVVGSGYGGAVAAMKFAQVGRTVCVLERGNEYQPGEFPRDISQAPRHFRVDFAGHDMPAGYEDALFDCRVGAETAVVVGNALGGGSQINASVALQPDPRVFEQPSWPTQFRNDPKLLDPYYVTARKSLNAHEFAGVMEDGTLHMPTKSKQLERFAQANNSRSRPVFITVNLSDSAVCNTQAIKQNPCVGCGDCISGCNYGAKGSLTTSLLPVAFNHAAELYTGACVQTISKGRSTTQGTDAPWTVHFVRMGQLESYRKARALLLEKKAQKKKQEAAMEADSERRYTDEVEDAAESEFAHMLDKTIASLEETIQASMYSVDADIVILAAGTLGSTEILLRSAVDRSGKTGPELQFSGMLGRGFSGNGDHLSFAYAQDEPVDSVGWGSRFTARASSAGDSVKWTRPPKAPIVGPTITSVVRFDDPQDVRKSFIVEDAAIPGAIEYIFCEIVATSGTLAQLALRKFRDTRKCAKRDAVALTPEGRSHTRKVKDKRDRAARDEVALTPEGRSHTQVFLTMGHDSSGGRITLDEKTDRVVVRWPTLDADSHFALYDEKLARSSRLEAVYVSNPLWTPIPPGVENLLSGTRLRGRNAIVHPLGGCIMSDDVLTGVVNHFGEVFDASTRGKLHTNLYVVDGSIIPSSLGANPFLTITALALRAVEHIIQENTEKAGWMKQLAKVRTWDPEAILKMNYIRRRLDCEPRVRDVSAVFREVLRGRLDGRLTKLSKVPAKGGKDPRVAALMHIDLPLPKIRKFMADPQHLVEGAGGTLQLARMANKHDVVWTATYKCTQAKVWLLRKERRAFLKFIDLAAVIDTFLITRGGRELGERRKDDADEPFPKRVTQIFKYLSGFLKLARHIAEQRTMVYEMPFVRDPTTCDGLPATIWVRGFKRIRYAATYSAIFRFLAVLRGQQLAAWIAEPFVRVGKPLGLQSDPGTERPNQLMLRRRSVWQQLTEMQIEIRDVDLYDEPTSHVLARGTLVIKPLEMLKERPPRLVRGDTTSALLQMGGYATFFFRYILKTRLWDFRLPDYGPSKPQTYKRTVGTDVQEWIRADCVLPDLVLEDGTCIGPIAHHFRPERDPDGGRPDLLLWHYRQPSICTSAGCERSGARQCKTILLVHAFGQSALSFAEPSLETKSSRAARASATRGSNTKSADAPKPQKEHLVQYLYENLGYDVWLLEDRISIALEASKESCTIDKIGQFDIAKAVNIIIDNLQKDSSVGYDADKDKLQIYALAQCVGSAAMGMALLGGYLSYEPTDPANEADLACLSKIAGVVLSQFTPCVVGGLGTQFKTFLPTMLRDVAGISQVDFSASDPSEQPRKRVSEWSPQTGVLLDRVFASKLADRTELCPDWFEGGPVDQACATCRRIEGLEARLFAHRNLHDETHSRLPILFGAANIDVFAHARKCIDYERLVDPDGLDIYVTEQRIRQHMHMPVAFLHGEDNDLFSVESTRQSYALWQRVFGAERCKGRVQKIIRPGYGHLDWLIGKNAFHDNFGHVGTFLANAWTMNEAPDKAQQAVARGESLSVPLCGPVIRSISASKTTDGVVVRLWMRPDETDSPALFVRCSYEATDGEQHKIVLRFDQIAADRPFDRLVLRYAEVVLSIPSSHFGSAKALKVTLHSVHRLPMAVSAEPSGDCSQENVDSLMATSVSLDPLGCLNGLVQRTQKAASRYNKIERDVISRRELQVDNLCDAEAWIANPKAPRDVITIFATCCRYPGFPIEKDRVDQAFSRLCERKSCAPHAHLFLVGDQIYADATAGLFDTKSAIEKFSSRYEELFRAAAFRKLVACTPTLMCIDDHEIADNWDRNQLLLDPDLVGMAEFTVRYYQRGKDSQRRCSEQIVVADVIPTIALDTRSGREIGRTASSIMVKRQWDELGEWAKMAAVCYADVPKVIVCGSPIAPGYQQYLDERDRWATATSTGADNWQRFGDDRERLFDLIGKEGLRHVVLISGDYHCAAVATIRREGSEIATAIVVPPAYAPLPYANARVDDLARVESFRGYEIEIARMRGPRNRDSMGTNGSGFAELLFQKCDEGWRLSVLFDVCNICGGGDPALEEFWKKTTYESMI